jgi:hypothetical protein
MLVAERCPKCGTKSVGRASGRGILPRVLPRSLAATCHQVYRTRQDAASTPPHVRFPPVASVEVYDKKLALTNNYLNV